jgi:hypothetical protein
MWKCPRAAGSGNSDWVGILSKDSAAGDDLARSASDGCVLDQSRAGSE